MEGRPELRHPKVQDRRTELSEEPTYEIGSGNVFADLGFPDAEELKAKAELVIQIIQIMEERGLEEAEAADILGVDLPKVSQLLKGKLDGFSMEWLCRFLNALVETSRSQ